MRELMEIGFEHCEDNSSSQSRRFLRFFWTILFDDFYDNRRFAALLSTIIQPGKND